MSLCTSTNMHACNSEGGNPKVKGFFKVKLNIKSQLIKLGPTHLGPLKIKVLLKANLIELGQCVIENHGVIENQNVGTSYQSKSASLLVNSISPTNLLLLTYKMGTLRAPLIRIFHL